MTNLLKKNFNYRAFTMVEILLVIGIIGIIAVITLRIIINAYEEAQYTSALKDTYSIISDTINRIKTDNGGTLADTFTSRTTTRDEFMKYMNYIKTCDGNASLGDCWNTDYAKRYDNGTMYSNASPGNEYNWWGMVTSRTIVLKNGSSIYFHTGTSNCSTTAECARFFVDTNGPKPPNTMGKDIYYFFVYTNRVSPNEYDAPASVGGSGASMGKWRLYH